MKLVRPSFVSFSMNIAALIAAVLLPPLGVFVERGMARDFWISVPLTILFFVPGMIFALFIVFGGSTERLAGVFARS